MSSDSEENDEMYTPPADILEVEVNSLPEKSKKKYEVTYKTFMEWRSLKNITSLSESVILAYFEELSEKYKSSSLWSIYSMLRSTLNINNNVNIEHYLKVRAFLKRKSQGYQAKKAKTFTPDEINKFINEAPDSTYLATKVTLIMGIMGSCRAIELHAMSINDIQDLKSALLVTVPNAKSKTVRKFVISGHYYEICKKYADLRPPDASSTSFFLNYQKGKCTVQNIGINKFGAMGKQIAKFLKLPNPDLYTGHSFRRSSATLFVDSDGDMTALKRQWKSVPITEGYTVNSMENDPSMDKSSSFFQSVKQSIKTYPQKVASNENYFEINSTPPVPFTNYSNMSASSSNMSEPEQKVIVCRYCTKVISVESMSCERCGAYFHFSCASVVKFCCEEELVMKRSVIETFNSAELFLKEENKLLREIIKDKDVIINDKESLIALLQDKVAWLEEKIKKSKQLNEPDE